MSIVIEKPSSTDPHIMNIPLSVRESGWGYSPLVWDHGTRDIGLPVNICIHHFCIIVMAWRGAREVVLLEMEDEKRLRKN